MHLEKKIHKILNVHYISYYILYILYYVLAISYSVLYFSYYVFDEYTLVLFLNRMSKNLKCHKEALQRKKYGRDGRHPFSGL
jgi:cellulose synthase/poly-beta-1,6-N-acetylglucosamine synthase-like glycosyltransferase